MTSLRGETAKTAETITIGCPDDCHVHLRDDAILAKVLPATATQFARGVIMPNLANPITSVAAALAYRDRILAVRPNGLRFEPLMTCYLTDDADPDELERGYAERVWVAAKLYPAGATTNAAKGVTAVRTIRTVLERMQRIGMPLLVHGESTDPQVDVFDREAVFMNEILRPLLSDFPALKVVAEHATTIDTIEIVKANAGRVAATITPHHLVINRTTMFQGGIRPHLYCLPVAKRERHRLALRAAATSGHSSFFAGTDTAPHLRTSKEAPCGCAGIFAAPTALQTYAQVFDDEKALDALEGFLSINGAAFYGMPRNVGSITLERTPSRAEKVLELAGNEIVVFRGGEELPWSIKEGVQ